LTWVTLSVTLCVYSVHAFIIYRNCVGKKVSFKIIDTTTRFRTVYWQFMSYLTDHINILNIFFNKDKSFSMFPMGETTDYFVPKPLLFVNKSTCINDVNKYMHNIFLRFIVEKEPSQRQLLYKMMTKQLCMICLQWYWVWKLLCIGFSKEIITEGWLSWKHVGFHKHTRIFREHTEQRLRIFVILNNLL